MKKRRIIICVICIFIVSVCLIGFTYGYYITQVLGNENSTNVNLTASSKKVKYTEISETSSGTISPGYEYIKYFTVTNIGELPVTYQIYLDEVSNNFTRTQDITYTLYRKSGNNTITSSNLSSCDVVSTGTFPVTNAYIGFNLSSSTKGEVYTYALKINYLTSTQDQNVDDGHTFSFKVQVHYDAINPFATGTLAYYIFDNALKGDDGTSIGYENNTFSGISATDEKKLNRISSSTGTTYYFRGNVTNNYVNFAGMCWRIVKIDTDGSIRLILEDKNTTCNSSSYTGNWTIGTGNYGYKKYSSHNVMSYLNPSYNNNMISSFKTFQTSDIQNYLDYLKVGWCLNENAYDSSATTIYNTTLTSSQINSYYSNNTIFNYDARLRLNGDSFVTTNVCQGSTASTYYNSTTPIYVGALTADEVVLAGAKVYGNNVDFYLINDYQKNNNALWWTISPGRFNGISDVVFMIKYDGFFGNEGVGNSFSFRPAVTLKSGQRVNINYSGTGTKSNPYVIGY